ncbi:hypothetical protein HanPI659440_Chr13g0515731 [Helianthus annuus]|nr:hypothetical protein HanPI659440_Chr13g0515731 [Helianthus annuus]
MSDQGPSDAYRQLSGSPRSEGTSSSQPALSEYSADTEEGIFVFKAQSEEPFPQKKSGWFSRGAHERRKRMKKLQEQRVLAAAKRETDAYNQDMLNRGITNIHILATTAADPNLEQMLAPQPQPQNPDQPMEVENQIEMPDYNPEEIPRVPAPNPLDPNNYDPWWDDVRDYVQQNPIQENVPIPNLGAYPGLDPQDPYNISDAYVREILEPAPYASISGTHTTDSKPSPRTCTPNECRKCPRT